MDKEIKIGYELESGAPASIKPSHLIVTGITQLSGKTTTLEALVKRSGLKAVIFKTKIGEKSFTEGTEAAPFFRDRSDYAFVKSLIEAYAKEKINLEKGTLMRICKGAGSLLEIKKRVDDKIAEGKLRGLNEEIYTRLQHYLENLIPQIQYANLSSTLTLFDGINIMNLERFEEAAQSLIIQAVADEIMKTMKGVIVIIPEAWKFIPQKYNNPCKRVIESFIRQGAANKNYIWIDSQDMAGVDKIPLKQISTWILGYQSERNEVKHTLDQIGLPPKSKPKTEEIMNLKIGHFIISSYDGVTKVYVQPAWMDDKLAIQIAKGEMDVDRIDRPAAAFLSCAPVLVGPNTPPDGAVCYSPHPQNTIYDDSKIRKQLVELRGDFFNKIEEIQNIIRITNDQIYNLKTATPKIDTDEIVSLVLQKMPLSNGGPAAPVNQEEIIQAVLKRIPSSPGAVTYEVAPLEMIQKNFLKKAKNKIVQDVMTLNEDQKKILGFVETQNKGCNLSMILTKCLYLSATSGGTRDRISKKIKEMANLEVMRLDKNTIAYPHLKEQIKALIGVHKATEQDIQQVYDHILYEIIPLMGEN